MATAPSRGHDPLSLSRLRRAVDRCDRFEAEFRGGAAPRIEAYLEGAEGPERLLLLRELLALELGLHRRCHEQPDPQLYRERFPGESGLVDQVFREVRQPGHPPAGDPSHGDRVSVLTSFDEGARLCAGFETSWDSDSRPSIESYLARIEPDARA